MAKQITKLIRSSKSFVSVINFIRAKYIASGKQAPHTSRITEIIANKINKEDLLKDVENVFIRF